MVENVYFCVKLQMMMRLLLAICMLQAWVLCADAQTRLASCLNQRDFRQHWQVESESKDYIMRFLGDTLELIAPKGLTLWRKERMNGTVDIEYDAMIVVNDSSDRLSDLNCFWMATDPAAEDVFARLPERGGKFANCATLQLYYVGYGGNYNSTTRFRRYNGMPDPPLLQEYTDPEHLLEANRWYRIRLVCGDGRVQYWRDGELLFDYADPAPLTHGWFGFRTTLSRTQIRHFQYKPTN